MTIQTEDRTPVIIGVGQYQMDVPNVLEGAPGPIDMTVKAIEAAFDDLGNVEVKPNVDRLTAIRLWSDSGPLFPCPFGSSKNHPASIAEKSGLSPKDLIYSKLGGEQSQIQIAETARAIQQGRNETAIICGGEAVANMRSAIRNGVKLDWSHEPTIRDGISVDDHGFEFSDLPIASEEVRHKVIRPIELYALIETAYRLRLGLSVKTYQTKIGNAFAPFAKIASQNPYSMFKSELTPEDIATTSEKNPMIAEPYTKAMVAKDGVNQSSAIIMTTVSRAKALGVRKDKWVFLNSFAKGNEPNASERPEIDQLPVLKQVIERALDAAHIKSDKIRFADFYSCFPIVVFNSIPLLKAANIKHHTLTGGLPFFGGPGNSYSLHAVAEMVHTLRGTEHYGLIHANGGIMTKHAVGVYSTHPSFLSEGHVDYTPKTREITSSPLGEGRLVSYCLMYKQNQPVDAVILALMPDGKHALAKYEGDFIALAGVKRHQKVVLEATPSNNVARLR